MIRIKNATKTFGNTRAVRGVSLEINKGELFGLIGPDGAGKTTLFRMITTLILPDSGEIQLNGMDVVKDYRKVKDLLGYMPGKFSLYQDLTVRENLEFFAGVFGHTVEENYDLVKDIYRHIEPFSNRPAGKLSGGMKQKLALSCALIHRPELLVLDEPTTGVDAVSRKEFWEMIHKIRERGITIIASTPYMEEAEQCQRVAFMEQGKIMAVNTPEGITADFPLDLFEIKSDQLHRLVHELRKQPDCRSALLFGQGIHYSSAPGITTSDFLEKQLIELGYKKVSVKRIQPGIEDTFMQLLRKEKTGENAT